jgi:LacI family transcriptional regulator
MASIGDVARVAGVSRTTVSHVISGKRRVSEPVAERVRHAMARLGYVPSRAAQNLAHGVTRTIGLLVPDVGNSFFADVAKGVESASIERGYNIILGNTGWNRERELFYFETLQSRAVDGVVYAAGAPTPGSRIAELLAGMPLVAVDEEIGDFGGATVVSDNAVGGRMVAEHLIERGHRNVLVAGVDRNLASGWKRVEGFTSVWSERPAGDAAHVELADGSFEEECGHRTAAEYAPRIRDGEITAVFALNDMVALGVLRALDEAGLNVPRDCSVVGFDDITTARHVRPGLTTVRQDAVGMGALAADSLLDALAGEDVQRRRVLPVTLIERQTTAEVSRVSR